MVVERYPIVVSICISLMISHIEPVFVCLLAIGIFSLEKILMVFTSFDILILG